MNKRTFLFLMMCLLMAGTVLAGPVSENQARKIAAEFLTHKAMPTTGLQIVKKADRLNAGGDKAAFYVFNASRGYVIVAGDDRAPAVLGYSDKGTFDPNNVPEAMQELLDGYSVQILALSQGGQSVKLAPSGSAITPLVTANWSQNEPYNTMLPMLSNGQQAVAGCVATALAQVLYHWKYPAQVTTTIPAYTSQSLQIYMPALEPVDFNWDTMQDTYMTNDLESEGAQAAARLTLYCAQALEMDFLYGASGAYSDRIPRVLSTYFGFKGSARSEYRESFSAQAWNDLIYNELAEGRPVIYGGSKPSGGHAFVCDGYDGDGMFHINWGWDGMSNGYYLLNVLNPDAQGTGAASEACGYIYSQHILIGIEPGEGDAEFAITIGGATLNSAVTTRTSSNANFMANVTGFFYNYTSQAIGVSYGWGLYDGEELLSVLYQSRITSLPANYNISTKNLSLNFGRGITSGTYRIVPIYSELNAGNWHPCKGSDTNYIEVTIEDNNCTVTGYGTAGTRDYTVNTITPNGSMHHGRPVDLTLNITNEGYSQNDLLYMFVNGSFYSTGFLGLAHGESGDVPFRFLPTVPGDYTCQFSLNQDGSDPLCDTTLTITEMPAADLSITPEVLNVTDAQNYIITSDKYSVKLTVTNNGSETYYDDITVKLYKSLDGTYGSNAQVMNQLVNIEPGETIDLQFDMDNVINGWDYFAAIFFYSSGQQTMSTATSYYTIVFPEQQQLQKGDVNGDGFVNISDVTWLISYCVGNDPGIDLDAADYNSDGFVNITDITFLINYISTAGR